MRCCLDGRKSEVCLAVEACGVRRTDEEQAKEVTTIYDVQARAWFLYQGGIKRPGRYATAKAARTASRFSNRELHLVQEIEDRSMVGPGASKIRYSTLSSFADQRRGGRHGQHDSTRTPSPVRVP
jgi:hypothetical protein